MKVFTEGKFPLKVWADHVPCDPKAMAQLYSVANMPFIFKHVAVMPDMHYGIGATVGSVIATRGAVIPAAVGVDIGCGMMAVPTSMTAKGLPDNLKALRTEIEKNVPVGRGQWTHPVADDPLLFKGLDSMVRAHPELKKRSINARNQFGSLGGGNHFIEVCLDERDMVWVMLHSGSRGIGNAIGTYFIQKAKKDMERHFINLPDKDLAYLVEGSENYDDYCIAVRWAQEYAAANRHVMMSQVIKAFHKIMPITFYTGESAVECHHNYISWERHFGDNVIVTRKGAVNAEEGRLGIIPGSMGAKSFIVKGLGNRESFNSCSHGAGRVMSRTDARKLITVEDHIKATEGVECKKDASVLDESPASYKNIDDVMKSQEDLVSIEHTLKQVLCVKG